MMYACKIKVDYEPQKVRYSRKVELPDRLLTLDDIGKHLKEGEKFHFVYTESLIEDEVNLLIIGYRFETDNELKERVSKQERYNHNYEKFHSKKNK